MVVTLAGRAAEQVIFGRVTTGAANDLEKVTSLARSMVFEYGMGESSPSRTMRADNYALSEDAEAAARPRADEPHRARLRRGAPAPHQAPRAARPRRARAAREGDASRKELLEIFGDVEPESRASESVGVVRALDADAAV